MRVRKPKALRSGSRVALVAPAGPISRERIEASVARCRTLGLEPVVYPAASVRYRFLAGTDSERLADLQSALDDLSIDGIWALRGGYGTLRILDRIDLQRQREEPIPFIGFSDNTTVHVLHARLGTMSFHGPHPGGDFPPETEAAFRKALFVDEPIGRLLTREGDAETISLVGGRVEAPLVGGNLCLIASLCGTEWSLSARGRILFLEDIGEPAYRVDRMLLQLERAGVTDGVAGLAFGRFTTVADDSHPIVDVLLEFAERTGVPAVAELPFGHVEHNCTLPVGARAHLDADAGVLEIVESAVNAED
jgi:muramoyltetrapeptide carboxypeptidase